MHSQEQFSPGARVVGSSRCAALTNSRHNRGVSTPNSAFGRGRKTFPSIPRGEEIARYETYGEAQEAVDKLAKADFPVTDVSIVGNELKSVERVTGKLTYGRAAGAGALSGAWLGLFFGLLLFIFSPSENPLAISFVGAAVLLGAGFGMLFGIVSYAVTGRHRDFTSVMQVIASSYSVVVKPESANRARNLLNVTEVVQVVERPAVSPDAGPAATPTPLDPA